LPIGTDAHRLDIPRAKLAALVNQSTRDHRGVTYQVLPFPTKNVKAAEGVFPVILPECLSEYFCQQRPDHLEAILREGSGVSRLQACHGETLAPSP
jgi:hypothetical protein